MGSFRERGASITKTMTLMLQVPDSKLSNCRSPAECSRGLTKHSTLADVLAHDIRQTRNIMIDGGPQCISVLLLHIHNGTGLRDNSLYTAFISS